MHSPYLVYLTVYQMATSVIASDILVSVMLKDEQTTILVMMMPDQ